MDVAHHNVNDESGAIEAWWPAVPFRFVLSPVTIDMTGDSAKESDDAPSWPSGEALPDDLRIEARSRESSWTLKKLRKLEEGFDFDR